MRVYLGFALSVTLSQQSTHIWMTLSSVVSNCFYFAPWIHYPGLFTNIQLLNLRKRPTPLSGWISTLPASCFMKSQVTDYGQDWRSRSGVSRGSACRKSPSRLKLLMCNPGKDTFLRQHFVSPEVPTSLKKLSSSGCSLPQVQCLVNPCDGRVCEGYPGAQCRWGGCVRDILVPSAGEAGGTMWHVTLLWIKIVR